jgi:hypothetical protein
MSTLQILSFIALTVGILVWLALRRFNKWFQNMCSQGIGGIVVAMIMIFILGAAVAGLVATIVSFLVYVFGGALLGALFAIPLIFGAPWWTLLILGAVLGAAIYVITLYAGRRTETSVPFEPIQNPYE